MTMLPEYVNTDLELRSRSRITSLVAELSSKLFMLYNGREGRIYLTTFEIDGLIDKPSNTADKIANMFCDVIENLTRQNKSAWNKCISRHLDMGFHSGKGNRLAAATLHAATIRRISKLNIAVAVSVYPLRSQKSIIRRTRRSSGQHPRLA